MRKSKIKNTLIFRGYWDAYLFALEHADLKGNYFKEMLTLGAKIKSATCANCARKTNRRMEGLYSQMDFNEDDKNYIKSLNINEIRLQKGEELLKIFDFSC